MGRWANGTGSEAPQHRAEPQPPEDRNGDERRRQQDQHICEVMVFHHVTPVCERPALAVPGSTNCLAGMSCSAAKRTFAVIW